LAGQGSLFVADGVYPTISNPSRASMSTASLATTSNEFYFYSRPRHGPVMFEIVGYPSATLEGSRPQKSRCWGSRPPR
jgi:hypothetical protein